MFGEDLRFEQEQPAQDEDMQEELDDSNEPISSADSWVVIESYFQQHNLVSQQIGSFNNFINNRLQVRPVGSRAVSHSHTSTHCPEFSTAPDAAVRVPVRAATAICIPNCELAQLCAGGSTLYPAAELRVCSLQLCVSPDA